MRELLIAKLMEILFRHGPPSAQSMRWSLVYQYVAILVGIDPTTKAGRKQVVQLDLSLTDFSEFDDAEIIEYFELVVRRSTIQM